MADGKYGRLFTEGDVLEILNEVASFEPYFDAKQVLERALGDIGHRLTFPPDEPQFVLRAKDKASLATLRQYRHLCYVTDADPNHLARIDEAVVHFRMWATLHPERMKVAD